MKRYTKEEIEWLKNNYFDKSKEEILQYFNYEHSWQSITKFCSNNRIRRSNSFISNNLPRKAYERFTEEEIQWLQQNYYDATKEEIINYLGRSWSAIQSFCNKNEIKRKRAGQKPHINHDEMIGKQYGELIIKKYGGFEWNNNHTHKDHYYYADCACGRKNVIVWRGRLLRGQKSCGRHIPANVRHINMLYYKYKKSAKNRNYSFNLTKEEFVKLINKDCYYCGQSPNNIQHDKFHGDYQYNGIDRVDNTIGYISSNVVPCCKWCNIAKRDRTVEDFYSWIKAVNKKLIEQDIA